MAGYLNLGFWLAFAAVVQPGPLQTYLISQTLEQGWCRTLPAAFAPVVSDGPIIILVLFLLTRIPESSLHILQIGGGIFLLYLAIGAYRTWRKDDAQSTPRPSSRQTLAKAVLVNFLNPNPYLGWSFVTGPLLLKGWRESPGNAIALLAGFYFTIVAGNVAIVMLFILARNLGARVRRILIGISVVALACFGGYELWMGLAGP